MKNLFRQAPNSVIEADIKETRPFFLILLVVLIFLYGVTLSAEPALRRPGLLIPFTLLMILHGLLHWYVAYLTTRPTHLTLYLGVQILIVIALTFITRQQAIVMGLYLALAGETVGILGDWRRSLAAVAGYLCLIALTYGLIWGWASAPEWIGSIIVMLLFVLIYVVLYMRQILAREEAQKLLTDLQTAHRKLAEYAQQVEALTLEAERQRMARELHDTLAQGLAGLVLQLETMEAHIEKGRPEKLANVVTVAKEQARTTLAEARRAIDDLRVAETSPIEAILHEVAQFEATTGIPCEVTLPTAVSLPAPISEHAIRFVAEGLANVTHHAQASQTWVTVVKENGRLHLKVRDNGIGFNPNDAIPAGHYGLQGLRERARLANGTLTIDTAPGRDTILSMAIPLEER